MTIHPRVRQLYKQFLLLGPQMPTMPMERYRAIVKRQFIKNKDIAPNSDEFKKALAWGRVGLREVEAVIHVHKFRAMKRNYDWENGSNSLCGGLDATEVERTRRRMDLSMSKVRLNVE